jgi:hypothetical protein
MFTMLKRKSNVSGSSLWRCRFTQFQRMPGFAFTAIHWHGPYRIEATAYLRQERRNCVWRRGVCLKGNSDKELEQMFTNLETVKHQIMDLDPNVDRSILVRWTLKNGISCYCKLYEKKRRLCLFKRRLTNAFLESSISIFLLVL